jgi:Flp pilus assembly protein TadB
MTEPLGAGQDPTPQTVTPAERIGARSTAPAAGGPGTSTDGPDWTDQVTDLIVDTVDRVRSRTTGPVLGAARAAVHAVVAMIVILPVLVLVVLGLVRVLDWALPHVWMAYALLALLFLIAGAVLWSRRQARQIT